MEIIKFRQPRFNRDGTFNHWHYWGWMSEGVFIGPLSMGQDVKGEYGQQNTGLKDKNGKEIYEGDVVKYEKGEESGKAEIKDFNGSLVFWWLEQKTSWPSMCDSTYYFGYAGALEIIGNIYENPELIDHKKIKEEL